MSLDSECLRQSTTFVAGYDLVLQADVKNGSQISTAQAASLVGHPFWKSVMLHSMQARLLDLIFWKLDCSTAALEPSLRLFTAALLCTSQDLPCSLVAMAGAGSTSAVRRSRGDRYECSGEADFHGCL